MNYILMNKDEPWLFFESSCDEFDEVHLTEKEWLTELRPWGYADLYSFIESRKAPKHRKHMEMLFERYGCSDTEGFLRVTHSLSLNDTFWVKEEQSSLSWNDVSLYTNEFDEVAAHTAFDGFDGSTEFSSTSPEFGTDGYYAKCWIREKGDIFLCKSGSSTFEVEPLSEFLASQVAEIICPESVRYELSFLHGKLISKCRLFTSEKYGFVKAAGIFRERKTVSELLNYYEKSGNGDFFRRMCILDALILNIDRHYGNFGMLADNESMKLVGAAPVFDNNRSLCFDLDSDQLKNPEWYIKRCRPAFGADFISTARGVMTDEIRNDLINMKGFRLKQHESIRADQQRLDLLSDLICGQIGRIV